MAMVDWPSAEAARRSWKDSESSASAILHLDDLKTIIQDRLKEIDTRAPIETLLSTAEGAVQDSSRILEFDRLHFDLAYIQFVIAYEVATAIIPLHPDFRLVPAHLISRHTSVLRTLNEQEPFFFQIKQDIANSTMQKHSNPPQPDPYEPYPSENTRPLPSSLAIQTPSPRSNRNSRSHSGSTESTSSIRNDPYRASLAMPAIPRSPPPNRRPYSTHYGPNHSQSPSSSFSAKGDGFYNGRTAGTDTYDKPTDSLVARFASLRTSHKSNPPLSYEHSNLHNSRPTSSSDPHSPRRQSLVAGMRPASQAASPLIQPTSTKSTAGNRSRNSDLPYPRDSIRESYYSTNGNHGQGDGPIPSYSSVEPPASLRAPRAPPKFPITSPSPIAFPTEPSPTYTPGGVVSGPSIDSSAGSDHKSEYSWRTNSLQNSYSDPHYTDGPVRPKAQHHQSFNGRLPSQPDDWSGELSVSPEKLYDLLRTNNVLVIDVRERSEFDHGHIFGASVLCVEPSRLYYGITADDIEATIMHSAPDRERNLFSRRDAFPIVVYYDSSTNRPDFIRSNPKNPTEEALRIMYDALTQKNQSRPLSKPPMLLEGGVDAWANWLGFQSLTSTQVRSPLIRDSSVPTASGLEFNNLSMEAAHQARRRRREFNPLNPEEERHWREQAQSERLAVEPPTPNGASSSNAENEFYNISTEEFNRRFPDPADIPNTYTSQVPQYPTLPVSHAVSRPPPAVPRPVSNGMRERNVSTFNDRLIKLPPPAYIHTPQNVLLPTTGLVNFGATCYMNAIVQCLSGTIRLSRMFLDNSYKQYLQHQSWKGSRGLIAENYANLVQHIWKGEAEVVKPTTFRGFCARLNPDWGEDIQQDSKEFFDFLLSYLHEDLNVNWNNPSPHVLSKQEEERREKMGKAFAAKIEWARYAKKDESMITNLFAGQHASLLRCRACGCTSTTYETFFSISVEIPHSGRTSLSRCLRSYCAEEQLGKGEAWKCPRCCQQREATKQIFFTRAPEILVVHFKRFSAGHQELARKIHTTIEFPAKGFDLGEFMIAPPSGEDVSRNQRERGPNDCALPREMTPPYRYDAYGVVKHSGATVTKGHYTALVRDPGRRTWREFNDMQWQNVPTPVEHALQTPEAYLVFYERIHER